MTKLEHKIYLRRTPSVEETFGVLTAGTFSCKTLELPDLNNQPKISCIPKGTYNWIKVPPSHIPYPHIAIQDVPNRFGICLHYGNFASYKKSDVLGCVLTGSGYKDINNDQILDIVDSKATYLRLMAILDNNGTITIE